MVVCCDWRFLGLLRVSFSWYFDSMLLTLLNNKLKTLIRMNYYIINSIIIHNMGQKVCHLYFYDNFGKCRPILTGSIAIWRNVPHTLRSNAVNKVQRSVLSTSCVSRIALTISEVRHETDESRTRGRSNMINAPEFKKGGHDPRLGVTLSGWIPCVWFPISVQLFFSYACHES